MMGRLLCKIGWHKWCCEFRCVCLRCEGPYLAGDCWFDQVVVLPDPPRRALPQWDRNPAVLGQCGYR